MSLWRNEAIVIISLIKDSCKGGKDVNHFYYYHGQ